MLLLDTHLRKASLCHNILVPIHTIQHWGTEQELKAVSHYLTFILTNSVLTNKNYVIQRATLAGTKNKTTSK